SLTRRIVFLNVAGLFALVIGILWLSQFRAGLIDARAQSLTVQGEIIAAAVAASATVETNTLTFNPKDLSDLPYDESQSALEFSINPESVARVLRQLVSPTKTRARIYDGDGELLLDSRTFYRRGDVQRFELPPPHAEQPGIFWQTWIAIWTWLGRGDLPRYRDIGAENGKSYPEVARALGGQKSHAVRINERGEVIVSVAVPVQRFRAVRGVLLLSTQGGEIDQMVQAERLAVF